MCPTRRPGTTARHAPPSRPWRERRGATGVSAFRIRRTSRVRVAGCPASRPFVRASSSLAALPVDPEPQIGGAEPEEVAEQQDADFDAGHGRGGLSAALERCSWPLTSRSEEHTSELQSPYDLVCRLLL